MNKKYFLIIFFNLLSIWVIPVLAQHYQNGVYGTITDQDGNPVAGATISLAGTKTGVISDLTGAYHLKTNLIGSQEIKVSFIGFKTYTETIILEATSSYQLNIALETGYNLSEVMIIGKNKIQEIEALAYNVDVIDATKLKNSTLDVAHALAESRYRECADQQRNCHEGLLEGTGGVVRCNSHVHLPVLPGTGGHGSLSGRGGLQATATRRYTSLQERFPQAWG